MPFDLELPARLLFPVYSPDREGRPEVDEMILGLENDGTVFRRFAYPDGKISYSVTVECDNTPHCTYCECNTDHCVYLTDVQVTVLREMLGV